MKILLFCLCFLVFPFVAQAKTYVENQCSTINTSIIEEGVSIVSASLPSFITYKIAKVKDCTISVTIQYGSSSPLTVTFTASTCEQAINAASDYVSNLPSIKGN